MAFPASQSNIPAGLQVEEALSQRDDYYRTVQLERTDRNLLREIAGRTRTGNLARPHLPGLEALAGIAGPNLPPQALRTVLQRLLKGDYLCVFFSLQRGESGFGLFEHFVARPEELRVLGEIFDELIEFSFAQLQAWLRTFTDVRSVADLLEENLGRAAAGEPRSVAEGGLFLERNFAERLPVRGPFAFRPDLIQIFQAEVCKRLLSRGRAIEYDDARIFLMFDGWHALCFERAGARAGKTLQKLAPDNAEIRRDLEELERQLEERRAIPDAEPATDLELKRAELLLRVAEDPADRLCVHLMQKTFDRARYARTGEWKDRIRQSIDRFRASLYDQARTPRKSVRMLKDSERFEYNPAVWQAITRSPDDILYLQYETKGGRIHVFAPRHFGIMQTALREFLQAHALPDWQPAALLALLNAHRSTGRIEIFFADDGFAQSHELLRRSVYQSYLPFWLRLLSGLRIFDGFLKGFAEARIAAEQNRLAIENNRPPAKLNELRRGSGGVKPLTIDGVTEALEGVYRGGEIATFARLLDELAVDDSRKLQEFLDQNQFKQLPAGDAARDAIILFRRDAQFPHRLTWLGPRLEEILRSAEPESRDHKMAKMIQKYIQQASGFRVGAAAGNARIRAEDAP